MATVARKITWALGGLAGLALLGAGALYLFVDVNKLRPQIQQQLQARLNRTVTLGEMSLSLFPLGVSVRDVVIGEDPAFGTAKPFAAVKELAVSASLGALFKGEVQVKSMVLREPQIELVRNARGVWNASSLGAAPAPAQPAKDSGSGAVSLDEVRIEQGMVAISELRNPKSRQELRPVDIRLADLGPNRRFTYSIGLTLSAGSQLDLAGAGGPLAKDALDTPFTGKLTARKVEITALEKALGRDPSGMQGVLTGEADMSNDGNKLAAKGELTLADGLIEGRKIEPVKAVLDLSYGLDSELLTLTSLRIETGGVPLSVRGTVNNRPADAVLDLMIDANNVDLRRVLALAAVFGSGLPPGVDAAASLTARIQAQGAGDELALNGSASLANVEVRAKGLAKPLSSPAVQAAFSRDSIRVQPFDLTAGTTRVKAGLSLANYQTRSPRVDFTLEGDTLDVRELQALSGSGGAPAPTAAASSGDRRQATAASAPSTLARWTGQGTLALQRLIAGGVTCQQVKARARLDRGVLRLDPLSAVVFGGSHEGVVAVDLNRKPETIEIQSKVRKVQTNELLTATTTVRDRLYGLLASDAGLHFNAVAPDQLPGTLNGSLDLDISDGRLRGLNLINEVSRVGQFLGMAPKAEPITEFVHLTGRVDIANGIATSNNLKMDFAGGTLGATGTVNLVNQTLNLKVNAVMSKEFSSRVGGSRIGGYLTTALSNRNGELVIPAVVTGTFDQPRFAPDPAAVAKMKLDNLLPSANNPGALIGGVKEATRGKPGALLDLITGKPPKDATPPAEGAKPGDPQETAKPDVTEPATAIRGIFDALKRRKQPEQK